jgi:hypothetical protein
MGKNKLRVRRLTLALRISTKDDEEDGEESKYTDGDLVLAAEHLHRVVEVVVASSSTRPKLVHGVEDRIGRRFWARDHGEDHYQHLEHHHNVHLEMRSHLHRYV